MKITASTLSRVRPCAFAMPSFSWCLLIVITSFFLFEQDCTFSVYFASAKEGSYLAVQSVCVEHIHPVMPELFKHLPQQPIVALQTKVRALLDMKANRILVREEMGEESENIILLKDLSSVAARGKHRNKGWPT